MLELRGFFFTGTKTLKLDKTSRLRGQVGVGKVKGYGQTESPHTQFLYPRDSSGDGDGGPEGVRENTKATYLSIYILNTHLYIYT